MAVTGMGGKPFRHVPNSALISIKTTLPSYPSWLSSPSMPGLIDRERSFCASVGHPSHSHQSTSPSIMPTTINANTPVSPWPWPLLPFLLTCIQVEPQM